MDAAIVEYVHGTWDWSGPDPARWASLVPLGILLVIGAIVIVVLVGGVMKADVWRVVTAVVSSLGLVAVAVVGVWSIANPTEDRKFHEELSYYHVDGVVKKVGEVSRAEPGGFSARTAVDLSLRVKGVEQFTFLVPEDDSAVFSTSEGTRMEFYCRSVDESGKNFKGCSSTEPKLAGTLSLIPDDVSPKVTRKPVQVPAD